MRVVTGRTVHPAHAAGRQLHLGLLHEAGALDQTDRGETDDRLVVMNDGAFEILGAATAFTAPLDGLERRQAAETLNGRNLAGI